MQCHYCQAPSEIRFTEIVKGEKRSVPICRACAAQRGLVAGSEAPKSKALTKISLETPWGRATGGHCPRCRTTLGSIRRKGRVGCPQCYRHFREHLQPLLRRVHGSVAHGGHRLESSAATSDDAQARREELRSLEAELRQAIESEDFEDAARIRDRLAAARSADRSSGDRP